MTIKEFIKINFNGNLSAFARAYDVPYRTAWDILNHGAKPQLKLRARLKRKGVKFD